MNAKKPRKIRATALVAGMAIGGGIWLCALYGETPTCVQPSGATWLSGKAEAAATPMIGAASSSRTVPEDIQLCQCLDPAAPHPVWGVDALAVPGGEPTWDHRGYINWQTYAQGEYIGHFRTPHVPEYRYRVGDIIDFRYQRTRDATSQPYRLQVGDVISVTEFSDPLIAEAVANGSQDVRLNTGFQPNRLNQPVSVVQPDGTIMMPLIGAVPAARRTLSELAAAVEQAYRESGFHRDPKITVTPVNTNTRLQDILDAVDARFGQGGQRLIVRVSPDGTVQLPGLGNVFVQGLSNDELKREVDERYRAIVDGIEVTPVLDTPAPRFVYVVGEVAQPGQYSLTGPTTVTMAIAMANGYNGLAANLRQVVVLRRGDDWRLMATMLDIQGGLYGRRPCPADEIWLNDSDIVIVPKTPLRIANEWIEQVFSRGIYGVVPQAGPGIGINFSTTTSL